MSGQQTRVRAVEHGLAALRTLVIGRSRGAPRLPPAGQVIVWFVAAAIFVLDLVDLGLQASTPAVAAAVLAAGQCGAIGLASRWPLLGWRLSIVATVATPLLVTVQEGRSPAGLPWAPTSMVAHLVVVFLVVLSADVRVSSLIVVVDVAGVGAAAAVVGGWANAGAAVLGAVGLVGMVAGLGVAIAAQRRTAVRLAVAHRHEAEERSQRAAVEERARIARELHDVVAHHLSAIAVRAESAPHRVPGTAEPAAAELRTIAESARAALGDMRRLLGVLRADTAGLPSEPAPDLDGLGELIAAVGNSGAATSFEVHGAPRGVPAAVGLMGYRVVQEALSNATRHAAGAPIAVALHWLPFAVCLRVTNGPGARSADPGRAGHGLVGMRERVDAVGGQLVARRCSDGGFVVDVTVPVP